MNTKSVFFAAALFATAALAADAVEENASSFRYGGDIRLRQELWDDIPLPTEDPIVTRNGFNNTYRLRSRVFGAYDFTDWLTANVRLTHMFYDTVAGPESFKWPDELSIDNANIVLHDLTGEGSKLILGRQDILLGSGRLVFEGTALDAARTTFFDGILFHQPKEDGNESIDIFAVYNKDEDPFAIGNVHRQLRGYSPSVKGRDEAGAGWFYNMHPSEDVLGSIYFIWKHETGAWAADGSHLRNEHYYTLGFYLKGRLSDRLSGELELATQNDQTFAHRSMSHFWSHFFSYHHTHTPLHPGLAYAGLDWDAIEREGKTKSPFTIGLDCLYLSADDPDSSRNEAFSPIFSRYPFLSELMIYCFDTEGAGNWSNILHPRAKAAVRHEGHEVLLAAGPVFAVEPNGAGGGSDRGWLYTAQYTFPLLAGFKDGRGKTAGCLLLELLDPGDYYLSEHTAYFFRWQITVAF